MVGGSLPKTNLYGEWGKMSPGNMFTWYIAHGKTVSQFVA